MNALNSNKAPVKMILRDISATMMTTLNVTLRMPKMKITTDIRFGGRAFTFSVGMNGKAAEKQADPATPQTKAHRNPFDIALIDIGEHIIPQLAFYFIKVKCTGSLRI